MDSQQDISRNECHGQSTGMYSQKHNLVPNSGRAQFQLGLNEWVGIHQMRKWKSVKQGEQYLQKWGGEKGQNI